MKLRYYLRGLGVGILLATIILTIVNRDNQPMTDAEVRARAAELGMVESGSVKLSELTESVEGMVSAAESTEESAESVESSVTETQESTTEQPASETTKSTESSAAETQESAAGQPSSEAAESTAAGETVTFEIHSGSGSDTVSRNLAAAGLVEDASAFDDYLCDNGYSRRIRVGTYEIPVGSSEEEIARIITGG